MNKDFVSRQQLDLLPKRLLKAEDTDAARELNTYMWKLYEQKKFKPLNILVVGAGGSYPAAVFAKHSIHDEMRTPNVEALTPQAAIRMLTQFDHIINCDWKPKYDLVIGISYSGTTPDIVSIFELCNKKGYPFLLVTGAKEIDVRALYMNSKIISYYNEKDETGRERGLISMLPTIAPLIIFDDHYSKRIELNQEYLEKAKNAVDKLNIEEISNSIKKSPIIHVFYEWDTLPTALDIESKFTESGIANVILHEKKNFSHGRFTSLFKQNFGLIINLTRYSALISTGSIKDIKAGYHTKYDEFLSKALHSLCNREQISYLEMGTYAMMASQWNIVEMMKLPYLITRIGEELEKDISKPFTFLPPEFMHLYEYTSDF